MAAPFLLLRTLCQLGFQATALFQFSSYLMAIPPSPSCAPPDVPNLLVLERGDQHLGFFSTCPTPPVISFSPSGSQSPTYDSQNFCLQLEVLSELQSHRSKCLLTLSTVCLIDINKTDTLILSHSKICSSIKPFPFQCLATQLFQLLGPRPTVTFLLYFFLTLNLPSKDTRDLATFINTPILQAMSFFYLDYFILLHNCLSLTQSSE